MNRFVHHFQKEGLIGIDFCQKIGLLLSNLRQDLLQHLGIGLNESSQIIELRMIPKGLQGLIAAGAAAAAASSRGRATTTRRRCLHGLFHSFGDSIGQEFDCQVRVTLCDT